MNSTVLRATKAMDRENRQTRKERVAVVEAWQNEWGDQRYCSLGRKILRDTSESAKLVATGIGGLINAGFHGQYVCCRGECRGFWRSESGTVQSSSWRLLTARVGLCYRQAEGCWRSESGTVLSSCWRQLTARVGLCYRQAEGCWRSESGTVLSSSWRLLTVREWDCAIVMLKAVDGQRVGLCYRQAEGCWRSESGTVLSSCWRLLTFREWDCAIVMLKAVDGQSGTVLSSCWRLLTVREWDCAIVKLKAVDGQRVGLCYRQAEGCWRSESGTVLSSCWRLLTVRVGLCYRQAEVSFCLVPTSIACLFTIQSKFGLSHPQQQNKQTRAERKPQNKKRWTINIEHKTQYSRISWTWRGFVVVVVVVRIIRFCWDLLFCCCLFVCCGCCCVCVVVCFLLLVWLFVVGWVGGWTDHPCFSVVKSFNGMLWWLIMEVCKTYALILHASSPNLHGI